MQGSEPENGIVGAVPKKEISCCLLAAWEWDRR